MLTVPALSLNLQMRVGPQLVIAGQILRASGADLEELIRLEIEANPALERVRAGKCPSPLPWGALDRGDSLRRSAEAWENLEERQAAYPSEVEQLAAQAVFLVAPGDLPAALELIYSLDEHGYLCEPLEAISGRIGVAPGRLEQILKQLHELEPPGVGARDLRECLLIQCAHLQSQGVDCDLPRQLLAGAWDEFSAQRWNRAARKLGATEAEVEAAAQFISHNLYPYPLRLLHALPDAAGAPLLPDLIIQSMEGSGCPPYRLEIPGEELYELRLGSQFERLCRARGAAGSHLTSLDQAWVESQAELARLFIAALEQRWGTLRRVGEFLVAYQEDFLTHGSRCLKPITRAAVAEILGLHESTVSRAVSDKIVQLPNGKLRPFSELFDASLPVKERIQALLSAAAGPLSDREIAEQLSRDGIHLARRTVTKYREQLRIPGRRSPTA